MTQKERVKKAIETASRILEENHVYFSDISQFHDLPAISIEIIGDWKHAHLLANHVLEMNGFCFVSEVSVEQTDDDCYTSEHRYVIPE